MVAITKGSNKLPIRHPFNGEKISQSKNTKTNLVIFAAVNSRLIDPSLFVKLTKKLHAFFKSSGDVSDLSDPEIDMTEQAGVAALEQDLLTNVGVDPFPVLVVLLLNNPHITLAGGVHDCFQLVGAVDDVRINIDTALEPRNTSSVVINKLKNVRVICVAMSNDCTVPVRSASTKNLVELGVDLHEPTRA